MAASSEAGGCLVWHATAGRGSVSNSSVNQQEVVVQTSSVVYVSNLFFPLVATVERSKVHSTSNKVAVVSNT